VIGDKIRTKDFTSDHGAEGTSHLGGLLERRFWAAVARREKLDQPTIKRLHREGYIEVCDVTHMQSPEREFLPTHLTEKTRRLLNAAGHKP
jgi:hypothetical protein